MVDISLDQFSENRDCTACDLHSEVKHVGIGAYLYDDPARPVQTGVVLLGQNPGYEENRDGRPAIGRSGQFLRRVLIQPMLQSRASVYLTNVVQCFNVEPTNKQYKTCFEKHFPPFMDWLLTQHERVAVVCLGGKACFNFFKHYTGKPVSVKARHLSGNSITINDHEVTVFTTFHPAFLLRSDGKAKVWGFFDHMKVLDQWLDGHLIPYTKPEILPSQPPEKYFAVHQ